jgi:hypothetical protein
MARECPPPFGIERQIHSKNRIWNYIKFAWTAGDVFAEMLHRLNQIKTIGDQGDFARAANQIEDKQIRAGVFLLLDGKIEDAKLRAWVAAKPAPERLFRTYSG